jgi:hypothetical protein
MNVRALALVVACAASFASSDTFARPTSAKAFAGPTSAQCSGLSAIYYNPVCEGHNQEFWICRGPNGKFGSGSFVIKPGGPPEQQHVQKGSTYTGACEPTPPIRRCPSLWSVPLSRCEQ